MTIQLQRKGAEIVYVPDAKVTTQDPRRFHDFMGQLMRWDRGTWQVIRKHKLGRRKQKVDAEVLVLIAEQFVMSGLILTLPVWFYVFPVGTAVAVLLDQLIALTFTILVAIRERRSELLIMFPGFIVLRLMEYVLFLKAFFLERQMAETKWFSPARY